MRIIFLFLITSGLAFAEVSKEVIIRGKVGSTFDDKQVKVEDSLGQIYMLPRRLFPKDKKIKQGDPVYLEIDEKEVEAIKLLKR